MDLQSFEFFLFLTVLCLVYHMYSGSAWQLSVLALGNLLFVALSLNSTHQFWLLLGLLLCSYLAVRGISQGWARHWLTVVLSIAALVGIFLYLKEWGPDAASNTAPSGRVMSLIGYSCFMFKQIHLLLDAWQGEVRPLRPLVYFNYMCGFYVWLAGPLQRYNDFAEQCEEGRRTVLAGQTALPVLNRMANGCLKLFVAAPWLGPLVAPQALLDANHVTVARLLLFYYGYYVFLYLNFTGYCDIVIGAARLLGIRVPENFNRPYLSQNVLEFWRRWHITLSEWLRDYVFNPTWRFVARLPWVGASCTVVAYVMTFLVQSIWHGLWINFFIFGFLHAAACLFNRYAGVTLTRRWSPAAIAAFRSSPLVRATSIVATNTFVAFTLLVFAWPLRDLRALARLVLAGGAV